jgi:peptidoglycan/LPS O-acetylase OafA/YrhL
MALTYRREIDGLRAVAVSAVVLFHAGLPVPAGFVGVDIFFVISGYLITALLLREQATTGRIDLADFYARRVRRIFPAAAVVILAVLATVPLLPETARLAVVESAAAAALFVANVYFDVTTSGYFNGDSDQFPLLHLWSLSVEEQFYLVWPVLLIGLLWLRVRLLPALAGLALVSFVLAEWLMNGAPTSAFYQMPARFWELAAGGLIAAMPVRPMPRWMPWAGLTVTIAACAFPTPMFPAHGALPAVAGAAMILAAIHGGGHNPILASRPMVGIGLISYSLYLWHWPLLAIERLLRVGVTPLDVRLILVGVSVLLAVGTYRYIETPLRRPWRLNSLRTVTVGFAAMAVLSCAAWGWRSAQEPRERLAAYPKHCHPLKAGKTVQAEPSRCVTTEPKVVLWGDSFARAWTPLAAEVSTRLNMRLVTWARDGCPAIVGDMTLRAKLEGVNCGKWNAEAIAYLKANSADTLIIAVRWQNFMPQHRDDLQRTVATVAPYVRRILIVGPTPHLQDVPAECAALGSDCSLDREVFEADARASREALATITDPKVTLIDPATWLCTETACPGIRGGKHLYSDRFHVSEFTAAQYGKRVAEVWN